MATVPTGTELDQLLSFVAEQRVALRATAYGLTDEQAGQAPTASTLSVGALLKHANSTELNWLDTVRQRPMELSEMMAKHQADFVFQPTDTLDAILAEQDRVAAETERVVREIGDLDHEVPVPADVPWYPKDLPAWNLRWVLMHLIEEIGRHAGHADIIRESIDGATMIELRAAAENWPESDWIKHWRPKADSAS